MGSGGTPKPWTPDRLPSGSEMPTVTPPPREWGWGHELGSLPTGLRTPDRSLPEGDSSPGSLAQSPSARPSLTLDRLPARMKHL